MKTAPSSMLSIRRRILPTLFFWVLSVLASGTHLLAAASPQTTSAAGEVFFEQKVRPLLVEKCFSCHSVEAKKQKGGLLLDSRASILNGGESGTAAIPGRADESLLIKAVRYQDLDMQMPPKERLGARDVAVLEQWIAEGMFFPSAATVATNKREIDFVEGRKFWSFKPLSHPDLPRLRRADRARGRIDFFVFGTLEAKEIEPAPEASRAVLLRRAKFDLVGLPPTPEEIASFEMDGSPDAYEKRIDAWLAAPQFGERWGRVWLDVTRYRDVGESWFESKGKPHLYRDWVINAINADLPYDRFLSLQLAADLMEDASPADLAALGFLGLSPNYWKELKLPAEIIKTVVSDEYEERVHTFSSSFLGINLACARCHDHKYDPFTAEDYYGIAGVFASTRVMEQSLVPGVDAAHVAGLLTQVEKLEEEIKKLSSKKSAPEGEKIGDLQEKLRHLRADPDLNTPLVPGVREGSLRVEVAKNMQGTNLVYDDAPADMALEIRGNPNRTAQVVPRRFPVLFTPEKPTLFSNGSGRLDLASALVRDSRALVARVMVNRIWAAHFSMGIVNTPSDFGMQGERPTHPELLDDLANGFIRNGWSLKWLHREIMLSATYRQAAGSPHPKDPELRLLSRFPRKRLDVEQWRDALLSVSGELDESMGGPALELSAPGNKKRTVYGLVKRRELSDLLRLYDFPDPVTHSAVRVLTTTPLQQLFVLNSPLLQQQAQALYKRLSSEAVDPKSRLERAYRLLFSREPNPSELKLGLEFIDSGVEARWREYLQVLLGSNEFLFTD